MVRTKKVSKGSRASTRASTRKRSTTSSRASNLSGSCTSGNLSRDSDGFAIPKTVKQTLGSVAEELKAEFDTAVHEYKNQCQVQKREIQRVFAKLKIKAAANLKKPIKELLANYQPPPSAVKSQPSAQKSVLVNSSVMQDRTNMQYASKFAKPKAVIQTDKATFKQPGNTRNSLRIQQQKSVNKLVTPLNARPTPNMPPVTPKVNIDTPLSVIRRPRAGEFAMSITGSPLMVSAIPRDEIPSVCVPLPDGTVLSILPTTGISADQLPFLDEGLRAQLETLQSNLKFITGNQ